MGLAHSPKIVTDGLSFIYDTGSGKSYKGEPAENLWDSMLNTQALRSHTKHYWDGYKWLENATYSNPGVEGPKGTYIGLVFKHTSGALNSVWSGNSYGYMLRDIVCTSGATFTQSCWIYTSEDCDVTTIPSVIEGESGGESAVTGYPASYDLTNKGTWQVTAKKAISDGNTRFIPLYPRKNGVTDGSFTGFFMWSLPQVVAGSHVVQPIQPGVTRSTTQGLLDLTKNETITLSNMSYDSNAQMSFDGTDDQFLISNPGVGTSFSIETVIKVDSYSNGPIFVSPNSVGIDHFFRVNSNGTIRANFVEVPDTANDGYTSTTVINTGEYYHVVISKTPSNGTIYVNGVAEDSHTPTLAAAAWTGAWRIGARWNNTYNLNGEIPILKVYNRDLAPAEVLQNYNALKSRFA